ncbi:MAG TPA: hypothetical protein VFX16_16540 [Pseudonocardiaceae bacterium]|nr:hypothetical protein [Pseudonocardiaceae bacterium]
MARFDPKSYEDTVVKPLRRWSGRELPDDLVTRYAVELTMSDADVTERLGEVRAQWHKGAQSTGKAASVRGIYKAMLRADEELRARHGARLDHISWWREHERNRAGARQGQIADLAETLRTSFGALKLISPNQLDATMRAEYTALAPDEVDQALAKADITRTTPLELPTSSGLQDTTYRAFAQHLVDAQVASVPELLFGKLDEFRILTAFSCQPTRSAGLSAAAVRQAEERENKRAISASQAQRAALSVLTTAVRTGVDLRQLTLFHLLADVRRHNAQGAPPSALVKQLTAAGLTPAEARMAVFSVRNESAPAASAGGIDLVRELLADGQLLAARQALATVTDTEDATSARDLVARQLAEVQRLRTMALTALQAGDEAAAATHLRQAAALANDDEDIAAHLRRIPPPPVLEPTAQADGVGVRVSWRPAPGHDETTHYRVLRKTGRTPIDPTDGEIVREGDDTAVVDMAVPAGHLVGYAVFAAVERGPWSRPAGVTVEVFPPVHDVRLTEDGGAVDGRWQVHPDARSVEVHRGDLTGEPVRANSRTMFRDRTPAAELTYTIVARYRRADGTEAASPPVSARAASKNDVRPIAALQLTAVPGEGGARIAVRWRQATDAEVVIRRATRLCRWDFGAVVPSGELAGYGEELRGRLDVDGEWRTLTAAAPTGVCHYVPFTMSPAGAVRGADNALGVALPVTGLGYQRFGTELVLSWTWPAKVGTAEIRWSGPDEHGRVLLTQQRYLTDGGCRIRCGTGETKVSVRSVVAAEGGECHSPVEELVVPERLPAIRYTVALAKRPLRGAVATIRLSADTAVPRCTVLVVAASGVIMPRRPGDGQEASRTDRELHAGETAELTVELPRLSRPYWVRCFLADSGQPAVARLIDPPINQLKVR